MTGKIGVPGRPLRRWARFLLSPNEMRRRSDRAEAVVVALLSAAFLCAVAVAPSFGLRLYQWERAQTAHLHSGVAILAQSGSANGWSGEATARWRAPGGQWRSGTLSTQTAPGIWGAPAGSQVQVWLTGSGRPAEPPPSQPGQVFGAVVLAWTAVCGAGLVLVTCYWLFRLAVDRRRLAGWDSDWALTGPRWTTRQG